MSRSFQNVASIIRNLDWKASTLDSKQTAATGVRRSLTNFNLKDMIACGRGIRSLGSSIASMEEAAQQLVSYFRQTLGDTKSDISDCALVRCFKTHPSEFLPDDLKRKAGVLSVENSIGPCSVPCLTLLASAGDLPAWNDRGKSSTHAAIPLTSIEVVERAPMIAQLLNQMGLEVSALLAPTEELLLQADERIYGVFHVPEAVGSPYIPAQDGFVFEHVIRSVVGFGGLLPSGDFFAMIIFSRVYISREVADLFRTLALSVRLVLLPFTRGPIFNGESHSSTGKSVLYDHEQEQMRSEIATLNLLLPALEEAAIYQTDRLEHVAHDLRLRAVEIEQLGTRLRSMLESTTDAVFLLDREWHFTYLNGHAKTLLQADDTLLGRNIWEQFPEAIGRSFWHNYRAVMHDRVPVQFEEHYPTPLDRWFEVHAFPSDSGIAVFFHDVTKRRKADAALMRTEKLAVAGTLAASIAHEINNPLESVTNLLYLARSSSEIGEIREYLSTADRELRRAGVITSQTLRFYKQSSNPTEMKPAELIRTVSSIYQGRFVNSKIEVKIKYRSSRSVRCFEGEILQVLNNLVGNAIDAMHPLGGTLFLYTREATDWKTDRKGLAISVADTGPGMNIQTQLNSFEPFFTTKGIGGTGLGLWISNEIVMRHKGRITLRSSQRSGCNGTVFTIFLPFDAALRNSGDSFLTTLPE